jgi:hypothetical protein
MAAALLDVQTAIYNKLKNDATLTSLVTGIFDFVPKSQLMPYIEIGEAIDNVFNTFNRQGRDIVETIYIVSEYEGYKEALTILDRIVTLLDYSTITLTSHSLVYIRYDNGATALFEVDNNRTRQVVARFRVIVQEV